MSYEMESIKLYASFGFEVRINIRDFEKLKWPDKEQAKDFPEIKFAMIEYSSYDYPVYVEINNAPVGFLKITASAEKEEYVIEYLYLYLKFNGVISSRDEFDKLEYHKTNGRYIMKQPL